MSGAIATAAIVGGASLASAGVGAYAANKAAGTQAGAARDAAQLQYQASQDALNFQKQQWDYQKQISAPFLQSGLGALSQLDYEMGIGPNPSASTAPGTPGVKPTPGPIGGPTQGNPDARSAWSGVTGRSGAQHMMPVAGGGHVPNVRAVADVNGVNGPARFLPAPGTGTGTTAPSTPASGMPAPNTSLGGYGSLAQGWNKTFQAPTNITEQNDPGYQARLNLATDQLQRSAAARGGLLTGGTAKALDQYSQDYASNEYGNVYNRALNDYSLGYNQFENNQANLYNRLAAMSGQGQVQAQNLGLLGNQAANNVTGNLLSTANAMGSDYKDAAAANASGYYNTAGAINGGLSGISQLAMLRQLYGGGGGGGGTQDYNYLSQTGLDY